MSTQPPDSNDKIVLTGRFGPDGRDRRRRPRVKLAMPVHIRGGIGSNDSFEDVGKTIDVSRDGLLVATGHGGYWTGQLLEVNLGCTVPTLVETAQRARVVRKTLMQNHLSYAVALEFQKVERITTEGQLVSAYVPVNKSALLVESDPQIASFTRDALRADGYHVVHATSETEALDILLTTTPDVLLTGIEGTEIKGQEFCSLVKSSSRLSQVPVIMLSHSSKPSNYSACHEAGAVLCMGIPNAPDKLQHAVRLVALPPRSTTSYSQLRKVPRYTFAASTEIMDSQGAMRLSGRVAEISRKGCYVDILNTLPVGTLSKVKIFRDSGTFTTRGKILYVHERIGMGVGFVDPPPDQLKVLDLWIGEFQQTPFNGLI